MNSPFRHRNPDEKEPNRRKTPASQWITIIVNIIVTAVISYGVSLAQNMDKSLRDLSVSMGVVKTMVGDHDRRLQTIETNAAAQAGASDGLNTRLSLIEQQLKSKRR